jgi:hypothetical protein
MCKRASQTKNALLKQRCQAKLQQVRREVVNYKKKQDKCFMPDKLPKQQPTHAINVLRTCKRKTATYKKKQLAQTKLLHQQSKTAARQTRSCT